ncbi:MAG: hypothetical protein D4S01_06805 [Dehalococcoidia bacterium]|nr:MAG: hypothetical protein D4S01_06805 [Dehalococcoidia bacterium]
MFEIMIKDSKLVVDGVELDLSDHRGKKVTAFQDSDGSITIESKPVHQTTICELEVPKAVINAEDTGKMDAEGLPITKEVVTPLALSKTPIKVFREAV